METQKSQALVVKSNALINMLTKLSLQGNRFLAFTISLLDRHDPPEPGKPIELEVPVAEFADIFDIPRQTAYRDIRKLVKQLQGRIIELDPSETLSGDSVDVGLIAKGRYREHEGRSWIKFDEDIVPHIINLKDRFTSYRIKYVYQFKSSHTWRLYELLKQYKTIGKREFSIEELKSKIGLSGMYQRTNNFVQRVLNPSMLEINGVSDIMLDKIEYIKQGHTITGFLFIIRDNPRTKTPREQVRAVAEKLDSGASYSPELEKLLCNEYRISPKQARQLANLAKGKEDHVKALLPKLKRRFEKLEKKTTSLGGYVFKAVKDELTKLTEQIQKELPL